MDRIHVKIDGEDRLLMISYAVYLSPECTCPLHDSPLFHARSSNKHSLVLRIAKLVLETTPWQPDNNAILLVRITIHASDGHHLACLIHHLVDVHLSASSRSRWLLIRPCSP